MGNQLVWFKRDLRLDDHVPLQQALARGPTLGLYVFEPALLASPESDPCHWVFARQSLRELADAFEARGGRLLVRVGDAVEVMDALHQTLKFERLWSHEETGLEITFDRDRRMKRWAKDAGVTWTELPQHGVVRPLPTRERWAQRWRRRMSGPAPAAPERIVTPAGTPARGTIPTLEGLGLSPSSKTEAQPGGMAAGEALLRSFLEGRGRRYVRAMSSPNTAWDGCSRLSPHLALGTVSLRRVYQQVVAKRRVMREWARGPERREIASFDRALGAYEERLRWHCHFMQKLESEPAIEFRNMNPAYDGLRTEDPNDWSVRDQRRFDAWSHGHTGFPMVDACMRCLQATGWINFRMRAMLVSVLTHDLWLHWRPGAQVLAQHFVDFEPGIHFAQFQMQAGTAGINALRIYDPTKQARDHDPGGTFIRRWVPELCGVPDVHIAAPHRMSAAAQHRAGCRVGIDYPAPLVNHAAAAAKARRALERVRQTSVGRAQAQRVFLRHGSRRPPNPRGRAR